MASIVSAGTTSATSLNLSADTTGILQLASNNGTVALTVSTGQLVGIGTTTPTVALDVVGKVLFTRTTQEFGVVSSTAGNYSLFYMSNGIGTTSYMGVNGAGGGAIDVSGVSDNAVYFGARTNTSLQLLTNNTVRATITSGGNFLWGVTTLAGVSGADAKGIDYTDGMRLFSSRGSTAAREHIIFYNPNGDVGSIDTSASATAYNTSSDYRLKENIAPMTGALAKVAQLKPCTYKWKVDGSDGEGFIAHELAQVKPDCVTGKKDEVETYLDDEGNEQTRIKPQGVDTSFLVATLTAAIQELNAKVTSLEEQVLNLGVKEWHQ